MRKRFRYRWDAEAKKLVEIEDTPVEELHYVITDEMEATEHPATGKIITSKKAFEEETFRSGCVPCGGNDRRSKRTVDYDSRNAFDEAVRKQIDRMEKVEIELRDGRRPRPEPKSQATRELWERVSRGE